MNLSSMQKAAWNNSEAHGFHEGQDVTDKFTVPAMLMLIVSELGEAVEEFRKGKPLYYTTLEARADGAVQEKPHGLEDELADVIIRVGDLSESLGIDLESAVARKMGYNATRPFKHGGKRI